MTRPWYSVRLEYLGALVGVFIGLLAGWWSGREPRTVGVPVAPGVTRIYGSANAVWVFVCDRPCAVVDAGRVAR